MRIEILRVHCYLVIVAAIVLYPVFAGVQIAAAGDTNKYVEAAKVISTGYHEITFRVPLYPLLLIATGSVQNLNVSLFFAQFILYFLSVFLLVAAMQKSRLNTSVVFVITLLLVSPMLVRVVYFAMTEALSFALANSIFALYILLERRQKFLVLGLLTALLALTRPSFQLTGLLITALLLLEKSKIAPVLFFAAFAIPIFLFSFFNKQRFNFFGVTPAAGWHLTSKTALFIEDWPDKNLRPLMVSQRNENLISKPSHTGAMFFWSLPQMLQDSLHMNYVEVSKYMMKNNLALIALHPLEYLSAVGRSLAGYTFPNAVSERSGGLKKALYSGIQFFYVYLFLILTMAVVVCLWLFRLRVDATLLFPFSLACIIVFSNYFASVAAEVGSPRHRAPTEALILAGIAYALPIVINCRRFIQNCDATCKV